MGDAIGADVKMPRFGVITAAQLGTYDLLIVGSPTQQGKELTPIKILLDAVEEDGLKNTRVAAFDTRHKWKWIKVLGYAAPHIAEKLKAKGGKLIAPPEGFFVKTTRGPFSKVKSNALLPGPKPCWINKSRVYTGLPGRTNELDDFSCLIHPDICF